MTIEEQSAAVIVAAGSSRRMQGQDKLWTPLAGRITLARTIDIFQSSPVIESIVLVTNTERLADTHALCEQEQWDKIAAIVPGGAHRQDSVRNGLDALAGLNPSCRWVMIHDGARPFVTSTILAEGLRAAQQHQASIPVVPVKDTIKQVQDGKISATPDRSQLWTVQTPQIFAFSLIHQAHHLSQTQDKATDDATLLEHMGYTVSTFQGSPTNLKITTPEDLIFAEALLTRKRNSLMTTRIGFGYDVHALTEGRPLVLGGVTIPYAYGLSGHSDADTVIHAIVDALLGAAALGDIGIHFPSSDPRWKDQPSSVFLDYTYNLLCEHNWTISNVDTTIVAEQPRLSPYTQAMRIHIANHLHLDPGQVSVKVTTTDRLGFAGRREGIACYAVTLILETHS
jgi:2-C-methyl-D-erythritol 4-phosphate cytidylyltransferase/2-C-methyl-D-erythritol 2,4-cyclodiphosphate synthase